MRFAMTIAIAAAAVAPAACEHGIELQGKVSVPGDVQRMFSSQHPGELVVKAQIPGQPDITAPSVILCEPVAGERVVDVKVLKLGCASEANALVTAWVIPRTANEVSCREPPPSSRQPDLLPEGAVASARALVSVDVEREAVARCKDGSISFALTLAPR